MKRILLFMFLSIVSIDVNAQYALVVETTDGMKNEHTVGTFPNVTFRSNGATPDFMVVKNAEGNKHEYLVKDIIDIKIQKSYRGFINGHEYVDLGLPSGVKWATSNVGASKPEEYGDHFAWGETETKSDYGSYNSDTYNKSVSSLLESGIIDENKNLTKNYDAAAKNWGGTWRMPTYDETIEILNKEYCTWEWTTQNGVKGFQVTSRINGTCIFLPSAGWGSNTTGYGHYWTSTAYLDSSTYSYSFTEHHGDYEFYSWGWDSRREGFSVRPVTE